MDSPGGGPAAAIQFDVAVVDRIQFSPNVVPMVPEIQRGTHTYGFRDQCIHCVHFASNKHVRVFMHCRYACCTYR